MNIVLAPIDFSRVSRPVLREAVSLARAAGARLVLLHVVSHAALRGRFAAVKGTPPGYMFRAEKLALSRLKTWQRRLQREGIPVEALVRHGNPGFQILEEAGRLGARYVVAGSHGRGAAYEFLVGSTTTQLVRKAPCAVLIVPVRKKTAARERRGRTPRRAVHTKSWSSGPARRSRQPRKSEIPLVP